MKQIDRRARTAIAATVSSKAHDNDAMFNKEFHR
jgi:hypothetical protein